jgi:hypothetical protein
LNQPELLEVPEAATKRRPRRILTRVDGGQFERTDVRDGFKALSAHEVDVMMIDQGASAVHIEIEQMEGPNRGDVCEVEIVAVPGPWWAPWRARLDVRVEFTP